MVDAVVHVPFGAHPTGSSHCYTYDEKHLRMYQGLVGKGNTEDYMEKNVFGPENHYAYLEEIGIERMFDLKRVL
ncbi:hypothetical protein N9174_01190 [bacterium]|nr:hypothetical protein [bacterium]